MSELRADFGGGVAGEGREEEVSANAMKKATKPTGASVLIREDRRQELLVIIRWSLKQDEGERVAALKTLEKELEGRK